MGFAAAFFGATTRQLSANILTNIGARISHRGVPGVDGFQEGGHIALQNLNKHKKILVL